MNLNPGYAVIFSILAPLFLSSCKKEPTELNTAPVANAGPDQIIVLPKNTVILDAGSSTDADNNITTYAWSRISGPLQFNIANANAVLTEVKYLVEGTYLFELRVTDAKGLSSKDTVQVSVTVTPLPVNNDPLSIISGTATLTNFGSLSEAKIVVPATAADKLVFAGGYTRNRNQETSASPFVDIYNLSTNKWSTAKLSEARSGITVATVGNKILYAGGLGKFSPSYQVDIYDAVANTWSVAQLSKARGNMTTAVVGNKAFFAGSHYYEITNRVDIYDASTNTWSTASLSEARNGMSAIAVNNKVFFAGGYRKYEGVDEIPSDFSARVDIYDVATNTWSTAELKEARTGVAAAVVGNKVLFAGGYSPGINSNRVDMYDLSTNSWSSSTLKEARQNIVTAIVGNKVLLAGGGSNSVDIYDAATNNWSQSTLSKAREVSSAITLGSKVLFFTGHPDENRMDVYDASSNSWSAIEFNKGLYAIPIVAGNQVFIGGGGVRTIGTYIDYQLTSNVWKLQF